MDEQRIKLPLSDQAIAALQAGDILRLTGTLLTARDAAHKRLLENLQQGRPLPVSLAGQIIYYVGPAPARDQRVIGPAGPTTSGRMDPYTLPLLELGVKGFIGKGYRSPEIHEALARHHAIYMAAIGGAAALLARQIKQSKIVAYPDLGPEAVHELWVEDFPVIVVYDVHGGDAYQSGRKRYEGPKESR
ncbi:MAG: FumA C-terminus/TtdB family hydratase beta subunit [Candidatus Promineifilaceae bacterium]|nr:FumA C-terminus/TtdB family hydratase beta subunit [Candidatus Promineifilaceae bacterium]